MFYIQGITNMIENLEKILSYSYKNKGLLKQALTHSSISSDVDKNYERLEFLGDRVLGLTIAALLYKIFPHEPEGSLSQRHTALVCKETVAMIAKRLELDKYMIVANEEIRDNENVLCDVCEAVIGSIYIDSDCDRAIEFVNEHWKELIDKNVAPPKDAKTKLQEVSHAKGHGVPVYKLEERKGSEHEPIFYISVEIDGLSPEKGKGKNKKLAEQEAAAKMLKKLESL